jgi:mannose-1-phosphate guanylyltransferase/mannose-6-phosphate isomerase
LLKINGNDLSLLQHTYERAKQLTDKIYVVSEASHIDIVRDQLGELAEDHFIVEPARRGTANCIVAALIYIGKQHDHDEPIAYVHADHYIRDTVGFVHSFKVANQAASTEKRIVLVGVVPDYPATGLGYIQKGDPLNKEQAVYNVHSFKEKPDFDVAKDYVASGNYLWNCGYFIGSVNTFKTNMEAHATELYDHYQKLSAISSEDYEKVYLGFDNAAIDYALMEKVPDLLVVPASFDWMDLGSFSDFHKAVGSDEQGNHVQGAVEIEEVTNTLVINQEEKPLAVIGLDNVVVVNTPNGILVARKDQAQKVGEVSKRFNQKED